MSLLDELDPPCPRGCGRSMDDCYEMEDGAECAGGELWQENQRLNAALAANHEGAEYGKHMLRLADAHVRRLQAELAEAKKRECSALCRDVEADRDHLHKRLAELENAIAWDTSCLSCSRLDAAERDRPVLEAAEARAQVLRDLQLYGSGSDGWYARDRETDRAILAAVDARAADSPRETGEQEIVCEHCNGRDGEHTVRNCTGAKPRYCVPCRKLMGVKGIAAHRETAEHRAQVESYRQYKARQAERWALPEAEEGLPEELLNARIRFWVCPLGHSERKPDAPLRQTVEWRGDVAHCLEPGCGRTSAETKVKLPVCADCGHRHRWGGECADHNWRDSCPYEAGADCGNGRGDV